MGGGGNSDKFQGTDPERWPSSAQEWRRMRRKAHFSSPRHRVFMYVMHDYARIVSALRAPGAPAERIHERRPHASQIVRGRAIWPSRNTSMRHTAGSGGHGCAHSRAEQMRCQDGRQPRLRHHHNCAPARLREQLPCALAGKSAAVPPPTGSAPGSATHAVSFCDTGKSSVSFLHLAHARPSQHTPSLPRSLQVARISLERINVRGLIVTSFCRAKTRDRKWELGGDRG